MKTAASPEGVAACVISGRKGEAAGFGKEKKLNYERDMVTERDRIAQDKFARKEGRAVFHMCWRLWVCPSGLWS